MNDKPEEADYLDEDYFDSEDEVEFDCHLDPRTGQCGSEQCDWECPNRNSEFFAGNSSFRGVRFRGKRQQTKPEPDPTIAGKFWWPSEDYSIPADNLCWHIPPSPNADYRCILERGHKGRHKFEWSPRLRDYSHKQKVG